MIFFAMTPWKHGFLTDRWGDTRQFDTFCLDFVAALSPFLKLSFGSSTMACLSL